MVFFFQKYILQNHIVIMTDVFDDCKCQYFSDIDELFISRDADNNLHIHDGVVNKLSWVRRKTPLNHLSLGYSEWFSHKHILESSVF